MSNNKFEDYPEWGAFGGPSAEDKALWQKTKDENCERGDGSANGSSVDRHSSVTSGGTQVDLVIQVGKIKITTEEKDAPEQIQAAIQKAHQLDAKTLKLDGYAHVLKPFIEQAMINVETTTFDNDTALRVWVEMMDLADDASKFPSIVQGKVAGKGIKYCGAKHEKSEGQEHDYYTRDALRELFKRRNERQKNAS